VLHLYREINLIFGFSEKLASVVGLKPIASLALSEVGRLIPFDQGMIVYKPAPQSPGRILAHAGAPLEWKDASIPGSSEIIPLEGGGWAMFAALKVKFNVLGTLLIVRNKGGEFSAEDLKLLTSLALQSASAMESSIHYEQAAARALEEQLGQLTLDLALRNPFFRKVAAIVENRFTDPGFGVEQLSQTLNMSPSQVQRKIMALTKKTPLQIIRGARMKKARELLQKTDLSVAEVAFRSGFADPSYFTRMFSKEEGAPPSLWKDNQTT
jgi:AraC-like DNA-binding protein